MDLVEDCCQDELATIQLRAAVLKTELGSANARVPEKSNTDKYADDIYRYLMFDLLLCRPDHLSCHAYPHKMKSYDAVLKLINLSKAAKKLFIPTLGKA